MAIMPASISSPGQFCRRPFRSGHSIDTIAFLVELILDAGILPTIKLVMRQGAGRGMTFPNETTAPRAVHGAPARRNNANKIAAALFGPSPVPQSEDVFSTSAGAWLKRMVAVAAFLLLLALGLPAHAQSDLAEGPRALIINYHADTADRPAFRQYLSTTMATRLRAMQADGTLESFRIFYSWYAQPEVWDAMIELRFTSAGAIARWNALEKTQPGGLDAKGLALASPVLTASADIPFATGGDQPREGAVYYIIPYSFSSATEYLAYAKAYVLPQYDGWRREGSLADYQLLMNRYPVGRPWDSLAILEYRDMASFGRRQQVLDKVREGLADNPVWKGYHARKGSIRSETENSIAELIAH